MTYSVEPTGFGSICRCDHPMPNKRTLRSPEFNRVLAAYWQSWDVSVPAVYDQILSQVFDHHEGRLIVNGEAIDLHKVDGNGNDWIDAAFGGGDVYRTLHRYIERADGGFKNRLQRSLIKPVTLMHFAREIAECASRGKCSCQIPPTE